MARLDADRLPRSPQWLTPAVILSLSAHLLVLFLPWERWLYASQPISPTLPIQMIDQSSIAKMRKEHKRLLLENRVAPESPDAPENARFISDRNVRVERVERARTGEALARRAKPKTAPDLSQLGVGLQAPQLRRLIEPLDSRAEKLILDPDLPIGAQNMLSSVRSTYYSFFARLEKETLPVWQSSVRALGERVAFPPGEFSTVIEVVLREDGALEDIRTLLSSGYTQLDRAAEASWRKLERYPNPPRSLLGKDGRLRMRWGYKVISQTSAFQVLPPTRLE